MKKTMIIVGLLTCISTYAIDLTKATIVYSKSDAPLVAQMAKTLANDIERVSGKRPAISTSSVKGNYIQLSTTTKSNRHKELRGQWERYTIDSDAKSVSITGSDARGLAYGVFHVSEKIGVSPWYWFADVPVSHKDNLNYEENFVSSSPSIKYRGVFINDEDWGMKTWASLNYEKELGDIGPKTYDRVCELILRLRGNMLAPAMHSCTGAFYSHPESQKVADKWGIMITTSHCEPLLFNNAAESEWNKERDGEWNYVTNKQTIYNKLNNRIRDTKQFDNIYTTGMRGLHDEAMKGSTDNSVRARTLESVFADQRAILEKYKGKKASEIPQIFVPYKETLDIYDAGLKVPEDITIVWPDDNYGYMKRVSNAEEQKRKGGSGVYYHLSYLGTPHDNLWVSTTAPALMYEELKKAYDAGADRYWLLNVGDIKPMEIEVQHFFDMAWDFSAFSYDNANRYQAAWLAGVFGDEYKDDFQEILDTYYRLAWQRKPEYMGYEIQWDSDINERLYDSDFSFEDGSAQKRLDEYKSIADRCQAIYERLPKDKQPAFFEMLAYSVKSAYQMNRKFLMAQRNHETGSQEYATEARAANDIIKVLLDEYNGLLDGKWNQMMSQVPPGFVSQYQNMPDLVTEPTNKFKLPEDQHYTTYSKRIDLSTLTAKAPFRKIEGLGMDWTGLQMGNPHDDVQDPQSLSSSAISIPLTGIAPDAEEVKVIVSTLPMWPVDLSRSNRFGVSVDGQKPQMCENKFIEWSHEWKLQVLENRKDYTLTFRLDKSKPNHTLSLVIGDPGQIIQRISYE